MELRFAPESEVAPKLRLGEYHYQHAKDLEDLSCVIEEDGVCFPTPPPPPPRPPPPPAPPPAPPTQGGPAGGAADDRPLMGEFGLASQGTGNPPDCGG